MSRRVLCFIRCQDLRCNSWPPKTMTTRYNPRPSARLRTAALVVLFGACVPGGRGQDGTRDTTTANRPANDQSAVAPGPPPGDPPPATRQPSGVNTGSTITLPPGQAVEPRTPAAPVPGTVCGSKTCGAGERCFLIRVGRGTAMAAPAVSTSFECRRQAPRHDHGYFCTPTKHGYTTCDYASPIERPRNVPARSGPMPSPQDR